MKFSVALCTYNGEKYIEEQLNSILNQSVPVDEIIICDDNSKDSTIVLAERILKNSGISYRIMVNDPPLGVAGNFLKALKHTTGDYVFTCDQDDIWHEDKVQVFANAIHESQKLLYFSDGYLVDGEAKSLGSSLWEAFGVEKELASGEAFLPILIRRPMVTGAAMTVSRTLIDQIDTIPELWLHDEWFAMAAAVNDEIAPIMEKTFDYRQHGKNQVGAKKLNFRKKAEKWISVLNILENFRAKNLKKKRDIVPLVIGTQYEAVAVEAVAFWSSLNDLPTLSFFKRLLLISRLYRIGAYSKYYTGIRGALRDVLSSFCR